MGEERKNRGKRKEEVILKSKETVCQEIIKREMKEVYPRQR